MLTTSTAASEPPAPPGRAQPGPAAPRPGRRRRGLWWGLAALVLATAAGLWWAGRSTPAPAVSVQAGPLVRTLQLTARVATLSRVEVGATLTGRVQSVAVREGDRVAAGQPLVQLEADELRAAWVQATANAQQASARLNGVRGTGRAAAQAGVEQAAATVVAAQSELERARALVAQGFISAARLDELQRVLNVARAQERQARAQWQAQGDEGSDTAQAQAQLSVARAASDVAAARLAQTQVRAPTDARVLLRSVEPGQIVQPGQALLQLALDGPTELVAQPDERFLEQLQVGQKATVVADAYPAQRLPARVRFIAPGVDAQRGAIEVKLALDGEPPAFLREDMTLSAEIETARLERALVLPLAALRGAGGGPEGGGAAQVWLAEGGRVVERSVQLGLRTLTAVQVTAGLAEGDQVLLGTGLRPGQRVRPHLSGAAVAP